MSYAPNPTRIRSATRESTAAPASRSASRNASRDASTRSRPRADAAAPPRTRTTTRSWDESLDWKKIALAAGGIAAGAAVGAGIALLFTERTGPQRRASIARTARRFGHDTEQRWEDLAFTLREAARSARDRFRHRAAADDETDVDD